MRSNGHAIITLDMKTRNGTRRNYADEARTLSRLFGFRSRKEFVQDAVVEKVNTLKSLLFARTAEKVRRGLRESDVSPKALLHEFE